MRFSIKAQVCADLQGLAAPPGYPCRGLNSSSFTMFLFFSHCGREEEHLWPVHRHQGLLPGCHWGTSASVLSEGLLLFPLQPMWPCKAADMLTWCVYSAEPGRSGLGHGVSSVRGGTTETRRGGRRRRSGERLLSSFVFSFVCDDPTFTWRLISDDSWVCRTAALSERVHGVPVTVTTVSRLCLFVFLIEVLCDCAGSCSEVEMSLSRAVLSKSFFFSCFWCFVCCFLFFCFFCSLI